MPGASAAADTEPPRPDGIRLDVDSRVKLAASPATPPALLAGLAVDRAVTVRAALALNPSLPPVAQRQLAQDVDERVRLLLARKLASALPDLSGPSQADLRDRTLAMLAGLVQDEAVRIRAAIASAIATLPDIPHSLVLALAQDSAIPVSEPVLRLSPLLTADDLLALLAEPPHSQTAAAIACRANLQDTVADAIAATADSPAIGALLSNSSAAVRESTLDRLVARASSEPGWHLPLVRRAILPGPAARALSEFVTGHLLDELAARPDLPGDVLDAIRDRIARTSEHLPIARAATDERAMADARAMDQLGELDEPHLIAALRAGENRRAMAMIAVAASVPFAVVQRAASLRSAKGLVSLVWKARFSARAAIPVQTAIGHVAPGAVLGTSRSYEFPLAQEEMAWQLKFLSGPGR